MSEQEDDIERDLASVFAAADVGDDDDPRIARVMQRIRTEVASRDVLLFVFVRIWATALEVGAGMFAAKRKRSEA